MPLLKYKSDRTTRGNKNRKASHERSEQQASNSLVSSKETRVRFSFIQVPDDERHI